jgi:hypothetical protein
MTRRVSFQNFRESGVGVNVSDGLIQLSRARVCALPFREYGVALWAVLGDMGLQRGSFGRALVLEAELKCLKRGDDGDKGDCFGKSVANLHSAHSNQHRGTERLVSPATSLLARRQLV